MSKTSKWILGILAAFLVFFGLCVLTVVSWIVAEPEDESTVTTGQRIALVELKEPIYASEDIVRQFKKYRENNAIRAIVFRVETPGGDVAASQEIYDEVRKTRSSGKPVVVSMGSIAASGGYYASCGATTIVANPGTLTGSIGVIFQIVHFRQLMDKLGIDETTIKSGKLKDSGSPFRKMTDEDKRYFQGLITDVYDQFLHVVATERKMKISEVRKYADGRVFTGRQAFEIGLVDTLGTLQDAIEIAARLGRIKGEPKVVQEHKGHSVFERLFGDPASEISKMKNELTDQSVLQYKLTSPYQ